MKRILIIFLLIILAVAVYSVYYYVYPEILFQSTWKTLAGGSVSLNCWGYDFVQTVFENVNKNLVNESSNSQLTSSEKISFLRNILNNRYENLNGSKNLSFELLGLVSQVAVTNLLESVYATFNDIIPENKPTSCTYSAPNEQDVSKILLNSATFSESGILVYYYSSIISNNTNYCNNQSNVNLCLNMFLKKTEDLAIKKRSSLSNFTEVELAKCARTQVYFDVKDLENRTREQLNNIHDPFSVIWKSVFIGSYDMCSKQLFDAISSKSCPIIPNSINKNVAEIMNSMGIFTNCSSNFINNQTIMLSSELLKSS